jgi:Tfp pilus assembly protein PilN
MRQQINLYQVQLRHEQTQLSSRTTLMAFGILAAALVAITAFAAWQVRRENTTADAIRAQHTASEGRLAESQTLLEQHANPIELDARVKKLSAELAARSRALDLLQSGAAGETSGFAARLEALARRHVEGVWLDRMEFSGGSGAMNLSGATLSADLVPLYLRSLSGERVLAGARFDEFAIERPDQKEHPNEPLRFRATSAQLPSTPKEDPT